MSARPIRLRRICERLTALVIAAAIVGSAGAGALAGGRAVARSVALGPARHSLAPVQRRLGRGHRRAAARDADRLLARLALAPGAVRLGHEPAGDDGVLSRPASIPAEAALVDRRSWWRVPGGPHAVLAFIDAHVPRGARPSGSGSTSVGGAGSPSYWVSFAWPPVRGRLGTRSLVVEVTALSNGDTGVRADAQVQWIVPRPAGERIPRQARVLDVSIARGGVKPSPPVVVTQTAAVDRIRAMLNRLPIVQPTLVNCPAMFGDPPTVTLTFRATTAGAVLAQVSQVTFATAPSTACDSMTVVIGGHSEPPLLGGGAAVRSALRLIGLPLPRL